MGTITHAAGRLTVGKITDVVLKKADRDREEEIVKLIDFMEKDTSGEKLDVNFENLRVKVRDKNGPLNQYINKLLDEVNPNVLKTMILNLGFEAFLNGTKMIRKNHEKYNCNVPWLILMDPTSACNLHCTGCWVYGKVMHAMELLKENGFAFGTSIFENPEILQRMVKETGAKSTYLQSPESAEHLCEKYKDYSESWKPYAEKFWAETEVKPKSYENYAKR